MHSLKIISGGQTGVDRAALDAEIANDFNCGGYCPKGRLAEDGKIPMKYPLIEILQKSYNERTLKNVLSSDATVIIYFSKLKGGTKLTHKFLMENEKKFLLINGSVESSKSAVNNIYEFVSKNNIKVLNFAGPRISVNKGGYLKAYEVIDGFLKKYPD